MRNCREFHPYPLTLVTWIILLTKQPCLGERLNFGLSFLPMGYGVLVVLVLLRSGVLFLFAFF